MVPRLLDEARERGFHPRTWVPTRATTPGRAWPRMRQRGVTPHVAQNTTRAAQRHRRADDAPAGLRGQPADSEAGRGDLRLDEDGGWLPPHALPRPGAHPTGGLPRSRPPTTSCAWRGSRRRSPPPDCDTDRHGRPAALRIPPPAAQPWLRPDLRRTAAPSSPTAVSEAFFSSLLGGPGKRVIGISVADPATLTGQFWPRCAVLQWRGGGFARGGLRSSAEDAGGSGDGLGALATVRLTTVRLDSER